MSEKTGKYGILRLNYLKDNKPELYSQLLISGELANHLSDINARASIAVQEVFSKLLQSNSPPDKTLYPERWAQHMNTAKHQAEEIVCSELIYV